MSLLKALRDWPLRRKLALIVSATSVFVLVLACATLLLVDALAARRANSLALQSLAELLAEQSTAALAFEDPKLADALIASLHTSRDLHSAALFDRSGRPFRTYRRDPKEASQIAGPGPDGLRWEGSQLVAAHPVLQEGRRVGTVVLASDLASSRSRLRFGILTALATLVAAGLIAVALALRFSRSIVDPVTSLSRAMRDIAHSKNYHTRLQASSGDELGDLVHVFNQMLAAVHERDVALGRTSSIIDATIDFVGIADPEGRILFLNPAALRMIGLPPGEDYSRLRIADCHPEATGKMLLSSAIPAALRDGTWAGESALQTREGRSIPVSQVVIAHKDGQNRLTYLSTIMRDLREVRNAQDALRRSEEQLRIAQKMEALGRLAGGIAHDFNNLLTVMGGHAQIMNLSLPAESALRDHTEQVTRAVELASALTRQLLAFSRRQVIQPRVLNLNTVLRETEKLLRRLIGENIHFSTVMEPDLGRVRADPSQMEQIIMNLAVNARDAMPSGGRLVISTANTTLDASEAASLELDRPGPYVLLTVEDGGTGIDAETLAHLFEPFFTTKERGRGTGLGLSTVYGIVRQSGGAIGVQSRPGAGSTFRVLLPAVSDALESGPAAPAASNSSQGTETVLVVEDEEGVRGVVHAALSLSGYRVIALSDPLSALKMIQEGRPRIDLVVSDVVMPGMSGPEMVRRMRGERGDLDILFISGYPADELGPGSGFENIPDADFLMKPFSTAVLAGKVRALLDRRRRAAAPPAALPRHPEPGGSHV